MPKLVVVPIATPEVEVWYSAVSNPVASAPAPAPNSNPAFSVVVVVVVVAPPNSIPSAPKLTVFPTVAPKSNPIAVFSSAPPKPY